MAEPRDGVAAPPSRRLEGRVALARTSARRLLAGLGVLALLTVLGTVGYVVIADMTVLEALYMTVITLSTVGYDEVRPLGPAGQVFTMVLVMMGLGTAFYTVGVMAQFLIEGHLRELVARRTMMKRIESMQRHVIVCGFGRLGRVVAAELVRSDEPAVLIDNDPAVESQMAETGLPYVVGSALEDEVLTEAGVQRAASIVVATPSDQDAVFVTLSARELNPDIYVHARADTDTGARRLRLAGAHQVIAPQQLGGQRIANALLRPAVLDFMELAAPGAGGEFDLEQVVLAEGCRLDGLTLRQLPQAGVRVVVVAIRREDAPMRLSPGADETLRCGDHIVVVGEREQLAELSELAKERTA